MVNVTVPETDVHITVPEAKTEVVAGILARAATSGTAVDNP